MDGLAGMRIFTIEVSSEGDVWIATENGISVWHSVDDRWEEYSRIDGFEDNHVVGIAFDDRTVHLAFACGGAAVGSLKSDRYEFKTTLAPWFLIRISGRRLRYRLRVKDFPAT